MFYSNSQKILRKHLLETEVTAENYGLLNGYLGILYTSYNLSKVTNDNDLLELSNLKLNYVFDVITSKEIESTSFDMD